MARTLRDEVGRSARYHVWEMGKRDRTNPMRHVNRHPLSLSAAKDLARIGATKGKHDRAVTTSPRGRSGFRIIAQYEAGTGQNVAREIYSGRRRTVTDEPDHAPPEPIVDNPIVTPFETQ